MAGRPRVWQGEGPRPWAVAAANLSEELGIPNVNTAKWLSEADREVERLADLPPAPAVANPAPYRSIAVGRAASCTTRGRGLGDGGSPLATLLIVDEAGLAGHLRSRPPCRPGPPGRGEGTVPRRPGPRARWAPTGAFGILVADHVSPPELVEGRRFAKEWECECLVAGRLSPWPGRLRQPRAGLGGGQDAGAGRLLRGLEGPMSRPGKHR